MAKTISISKSRILIQELVTFSLGFFGVISYWLTKFDTDAQYLKTDPNGSLKVGGYVKCPTFYGTSTSATTGITEKDNGWFPSLVLKSDNVNYTQLGDLYVDVPSWSDFKIIRGGGTVVKTFYSTYQSIMVGTTAVGYFRWRARQAEYYNDGESVYYAVYIDLVDVSFYSSSTDATCKFPYVNINNWTGTYDYGDGPVTITFGNTMRWQDEGGIYYYTYAARYDMCMMFVKNPVTLSIAVTP